MLTKTCAHRILWGEVDKAVTSENGRDGLWRYSLEISVEGSEGPAEGDRSAGGGVVIIVLMNKSELHARVFPGKTQGDVGQDGGVGYAFGHGDIVRSRQ